MSVQYDVGTPFSVWLHEVFFPPAWMLVTSPSFLTPAVPMFHFLTISSSSARVQSLEEDGTLASLNAGS